MLIFKYILSIVVILLHLFVTNYEIDDSFSFDVKVSCVLRRSAMPRMRVPKMVPPYGTAVAPRTAQRRYNNNTVQKSNYNNNNNNSSSSSNELTCLDSTFYASPRACSTVQRPQKKRKVFLDHSVFNNTENSSENEQEYHSSFSKMLQRCVLDTVMEKQMEINSSQNEMKISVLENERKQVKANTAQYSELSILSKELEKLDKMSENLQDSLNLVDEQLENNLRAVMIQAADKLETKNISAGSDKMEIASVCTSMRESLGKLHSFQTTDNLHISAESIKLYEDHIGNLDKMSEKYEKNLQILNMLVLSRSSQEMPYEQ